jgi:hypothetical protein
MRSHFAAFEHEIQVVEHEIKVVLSEVNPHGRRGLRQAFGKVCLGFAGRSGGHFWAVGWSVSK